MKYIFSTILLLLLLNTTIWAEDRTTDPIINLYPDEISYESGVILLKIYDMYADRNLSFDKEAGTSVENGIAGLSELYQEFGVTSVERLFAFAVPNPELPHNLSTCYEIKYNSGRDAKEVAERFAVIAEVEFAEPDYHCQMDLVPNDPDRTEQSYLSTVNAYKAWDITTSDATQVISIVDTGVDIEHVDLKDNIFANIAEINGTDGIDDDGNGFVDDFHGWDFVNDDNLAMDDNCHGTHVAGIAAAKTNNGIGIAGIAWNAKIMPVKVLQSSGRGSWSDVAQGVTYASLNGATVINMSLGGYAESQTLAYALENAYHYSFLVAAAGNDGRGITFEDCGPILPPPMPHFPACYSYVMGVQSPASFSNYDCTGPYKAANTDGFNYEVKYPGSGIYSTVPGNKYKKLSGTSMASPIVAGAAALLKSHFPNASHEEIFVRLIESGNDIEKALTINLPPKLVLASFNVVDTLDGDSDGRVDAGETIQLQVTVKNFGFQANNIQAKLRLGEYEDKTTCTITDSTSSMNNASAYARVDNNDNTFEIEIADDIANDRDIVFEVEFTCSNSTEKFMGSIILTAENGEELGGIYKGLTRLTADKQYIVTESMICDSLIIEPGVKLQIGAQKSIFGDSFFYCSGTPDSTITLTKFDNSNNDWAGLKTNSSNSLFEYGKCEYITGNGFFKNFLSVSNTYIQFCNESLQTSGNYIDDFSKNVVCNHSTTYNYIMVAWETSITNNVFANNYCNTAILNLVVPSINNKIMNYFQNNPTHELFISSWANTSFINLPLNYFGTINRDTIAKRTIDYFENSNLPAFVIDTILTVPPVNNHGYTWKVELNDIDAQDEYDDLEAMSSESAKFDVYFNRAMDTTQTPFLTFGVREPWTQKAVADSGKWISWKRDSLVGDAIYHLQVSEDEEFASIIWEEDTLECVTREISGLDSNGKYFWRVRYKNDGDDWNDWSDTYMFTTFRKGVPPAPVLLSPIDGDSALYTDLTIKWNKSEFADSVEIEMATDSGFSNIIRSSKKMNIFCEELELNNLSKATDYYWRVRFKNSSGYSAWSSRNLETYTDSLKAPKIDFPYEGGDGYSGYIKIQLDSSITGEQYVYQFATSNDFENSMFSLHTEPKNYYHFYTSYLDRDIYLRVQIKNENSESKWSDVVKYYIPKRDSIHKVNLLEPQNEEIVRDSDIGVCLSWNYALGSYYSYLDIATDSLFTSYVTQNRALYSGDTTCCIESLSVNQTYYWRVRGKTYSGMYSPWSETSSFTITTDNDIPKPLLCVPSDEARGQKTDSLLLKWNNAPGANTVYDARWQAYYTFDYKTGDGLQRIRVAGAKDNEYFEAPVEDYRFNFEVQATSGASNDFMANSNVGKIDLEWDKPEDDGWLGFNVYRFIQQDSLTWGDTTMVNNQLILDSNFTDYSAIPDSNYFYVYRILRTTLEESDDSKMISGFAYPEVLAAPILLAPSNDTTNLAVDIHFDWDEPSGAETYILYIARDELFADIVVEATNLAVSEYDATNLPNDTRLYWKVKADGIQGSSFWSETFNFTVKPVIPEVPVLTYPVDNATQVLTTTTFDWNPATYATSYQLQIAYNSSFSNILFDQTKITNSSQYVNILKLNTKYYWRVRGANASGYSQWSDIESFTTDSVSYYDTPENWDITTATGTNSTIIVQNALNIVIGERNIAVGDVIGVFYRDGLAKRCAGSEVWTGQNLAVTVWGDDEQTTVKDGFYDNEKYTMKLWDAKAGKEYSTQIAFDKGPDAYVNNSVSYLSFLQSVDTETHNLKLDKGWNMASSYIVTENDSIDVICQPVANNLLLAKNGAGSIYYPELGIDKIYTWNLEEGYLFYMTNADTLQIEGLVADAGHPIYLNNGWNMIAYLYDKSQDIATAYAAINSNILLAKNGAGSIYYPALSIDKIHNLNPGEGYLVYMTASDTLEYPTPPKTPPLRKQTTEGSIYTNRCANPSCNNATVILSSTMPEGTEITAYNTNGDITGSGLILNGVAAITIYGDDEFTDATDGARQGENITFTARFGNTEQDLELTDIKGIISNKEYNNLTYHTNDLTIAKVNTEADINLNTPILTVTPNPVSDFAEISVNTAITKQVTNANISLFDNTGKLIKTVYTGELSMQNFKLQLDCTELANGTYSVVLIYDGKQEVAKLIIQK